MAQRVRREDRSKKAKRFASLRQRRVQHAVRYEALERRQRSESSRLLAARRRCLPASAHPTTATVERRRREYLDVPSAAPTRALPRTVVTSIAIAFALPLVIAIVSSFAPNQLNVAARLHSTRAQMEAARARGIDAKPREVARLSAPERVIVRPQPNKLEQTTHAVALQMTPQRQRVAVVAPTVRQQSAPAIASSPLAVSPVQPAAAVPPAAQISKPAAPAQAPPPAARQIALAPARAPVARLSPASPWTLSPDGLWVATVHAPAGMSDVSFDASTGQIIALERSPIDGEAATVTIGWSRPVNVSITSNGETRSVALPAPDDSTAAFAAAARTVGPHLVNVGWTPLEHDAAVVDYKVYRTSGADDPQLVAQLPPVKHSWRDLHVAAETSYSYDVVADTDDGAIEANTQTVSTPQELPSAPASALAGKGMFLFFSSMAGDQRFFGRYHPEAVIAEAHKAGIRVIELRMARGSCAMAQTADSRAWLDRLIDAAARADIRLVAWTVPRRVTTQDLAQTVAAAAYRTPAGNGFVGLAVDLETGDHYMGYGRKAVAGMVQYIRIVRSATGPHYLIVATVASPEMGNHTNADYPYAKIAAYADVLQPMEYWHYFEETSHHEYGRGEVAGASAGAVARTRELAGRDIPVNVAGQSVALEGTGAPSGREIQWSLGGAKSAGGIGETFFDWAGTRPDAWAAIQAFDW